MGVYDYESKLADLTSQYDSNRAAQEFGRFLSQQRFSRQRSDMNQSFTRQFPKVTGALAHRFGGNVRSGQIGRQVGNYVGDYSQSQGDLNTDQAAYESNYTSQAAMQQAQYQAAYLKLMEQLAAERAAQNPFDPYTGVYQ